MKKGLMEATLRTSDIAVRTDRRQQRPRTPERQQRVHNQSDAGVPASAAPRHIPRFTWVLEHDRLEERYVH